MQTRTEYVQPGKISGVTQQNADNYPSDKANIPLKGEQAMALLALSHTKVEHKLYAQMLSETERATTRVGAFSVRHLMVQTGIHSYSNVRRAREGLVKKLSIEPQRIAGSFSKQKAESDGRLNIVYVIYHPAEIFARRQQAGLRPFPKEILGADSEFPESIEVLEKLADEHNLSRREAQVALKCAEGLSNAKIGQKLFIHEETVKFHLRNIFVKFGVKKRTELMVRL